MIVIDGSAGEGGGQILRTALTLSMISGRPFLIENIRANRSVSGLRPQHLAAVRLAAQISSAEVNGDEPGSQWLKFAPGKIKPGAYAYDIGTAGSTSLLLQAVFLPLAFQNGSTTLALQGGTHVPSSPSYHFLSDIWLPFMNQLGIPMDLRLQRAGYYPEGGGQIYVRLKSAEKILPIAQLERGELLRIRGNVGISNLRAEIAQRMKHQALRRLEAVIRDVKIKTVEFLSASAGIFIFLMAEFENAKFGFCGLGRKGKRAEHIADETVDQLVSILHIPGAVDYHLGDQILLPLAFSETPSSFSTPVITRHLTTNATMIKKFIPVSIKIQGALGNPGKIEIWPD
jgi:RNA 3'-terminal phosphate cyclase (ATP)